MGRIRTLKPEVHREPRYTKLPDAVRLLFLTLYSLVDDRGNCPAGPSFIRGQVFAEGQRSLIAIGKMLAALELARLIDRYVVDGQNYLAIIGWLEKGAPTYQRIDKPQEPIYPLPSSLRSWNDFPPDPKGRDPKGTEGNGVGAPAPARALSQDTVPPPDPPPDPAPDPHPHRMPTGWRPEDSEPNREAEAKAIARGVDLDQQRTNLRDYVLRTGETTLDWNARWRMWLSIAYPAATTTKYDDERTRIRKIPTLGYADSARPRPRPDADDPLADPLERADAPGDPTTTDDGVS